MQKQLLCLILFQFCLLLKIDMQNDSAGVPVSFKGLKDWYYKCMCVYVRGCEGEKGESLAF